jgi:hypothetical protein
VLALGAAAAVWFMVKGGAKGRDRDEEPPSTKTLAPCAKRIPVDSQGWIFNHRTLISSKAAVICYQRANEQNKLHCVVYGLPRGSLQRTFELTTLVAPQNMALSPDGSHLAIEDIFSNQDETFDHLVTVLSLPAGKAVFRRWQPYPTVAPMPREKAKEFQLAWMTFLDANRLLTLTQGGWVTLWSLPERKPLYSKRPIVPKTLRELGRDSYSWLPSNFALSPDRNNLTLEQGDGVVLVDTATGNVTETLPRPNGIGNFPQFQGMAISPDGKRLAAAIGFTDNSAFRGNRIIIWDIPKRRVMGSHRLPNSMAGTALTWWGSHHLLILKGNDGESLLWSTETGKPLRQCFAPDRGRYVNGSLDGKLWYVSSVTENNTRLLAYASPDDFLAKDPTEHGGPGYLKQIWLTVDGVERNVSDLRGNRRIQVEGS